ncbi:exportin-T [Hyalella azteca]|uniref:Exportin-T n=1 Tax=Hyalella azteca TaxID=294128 RepID=A0A979FFM1_HYAAZ|nr:exportin-T [Hyalella azteca]
MKLVVDNQDKALEYLNSLHSQPDSWQPCAATLCSGGAQLDDKIKFLCLQVLENYIKKFYKNADTEAQSLLRQHLSQWMSTICSQSPEQQEKVFIRNKTAQVLALVFVVDYDVRWPTYINDLLALLQLGPQAADLYLKILQAIDSEVVDRDTLLSQDVMEHGNLLKDRMRERVVADMANSWYDILVKYERSNPEIVCQCHEVIGSYISWIDISLIANERFVSVLVRHMQDPLLREAAAECLLEIITKGMDPITKMNLIESLCVVLDQAGLLKPIDDDESDFLVKLAKLVNGIGCQLILAWHKLDKKDAAGRDAVRTAIENKSVLLLQFFASEYDDVSAAVFDFSRAYIQMVKQIGHVSEVDKGRLENLLFIIINKTKYDDGYNFDQEGEDEAMFDEYRKSLKVVFDNLAVLVPDLVLKVCRDYVMTTLGRWQATSWQESEACVALLYSLGEAVPAHHGNHFTGPFQMKSAAMCDMVRLLVLCGISSHSHPAVAIQFFECIARYEKFFVVEPQHISPVLEAFLDHRGMRNPSPKVRSRCSYLFLRFVRCLKYQLVPYASKILTQLQPMLTISDVPYSINSSVLLSPDDQVYVYEASALLVVGCGGGGSSEPSASLTAEDRSALMSQLLTPLLEVVQQLARVMAQNTNPIQKSATATIICHCMALTARTSKAFSQQSTMSSCQCVHLYVHAAKLFIECVNLDVERETISLGLRQLLHRLVVCLDSADLLPLMPAAAQALLHTSSVHSLTEFLPLINQLMTKFKKECSSFVENVLTPLICAIIGAVDVTDASDEEEARQKRTLLRGYYVFLSTVVSSGLLPLLASLAARLLDQVLLSVVHGAVEFPDPAAQKICFALLRKIIEEWGASEEAPNNFVDFMYNQVVPACFSAPLKTTFNLNDAQTTLALQESASCLREIHNARGDDLIKYLRDVYFPKMELAPHLSNEYCHALSSDAKFFKNYVKVFFQSVK